MTLSTEEAAELTATYNLMSADELRAQLGDSDDEDALINAVLDGGRAVETKAGKTLQDAADDDAGDDDPAPAKKPVATDEDDDGDEDGDEDGDQTPAAKVIDADAGKIDDSVIDGAELITEVTDLSANVPALDLRAVDDRFTTALAALDEAKAQKLQDMMDGTIDAKEYSKADAEYMRDRDALKDQRADEIEWFGIVHAFQVDAARNGVNYSADAEKMSALDDWVKRLSTKPENADRPGKWFLEQAHKKVMSEFDIPMPGAKAAPAAAPAKPAAPKKAGRAPNLEGIPPSLGGLPAAAETEAGDAGEFSGIDKLSGMAYERALASLTPEQKARYEAM
jgi:hypothetical protein